MLRFKRVISPGATAEGFSRFVPTAYTSSGVGDSGSVHGICSRTAPEQAGSGAKKGVWW